MMGRTEHRDVARDRISLLIADASPEWRRRVSSAARALSIAVVAEASTAAEFLALTSTARPDIALVDVELPGGGLMAAARSVARHPRLQVVVAADGIEADQVLAVLRAGAHGVVLKSDPLDRLPWALQGVMAGQLALPRHLVRTVVQDLLRPGSRRRSIAHLAGSERLSPREHQAVRLLLEGKSTTEIAEAMFVSPGSVRGYLSRALSKLRVATREELRTLVNRRVPVSGDTQRGQRLQ